MEQPNSKQLAIIQRYIDTKQARINKYLSSKPSPRSFGTGDEVMVTYPPSKYFKKTGTVVDLNYLESSARKGYGDYSVTVEFPGGVRRRFLMGRVQPLSNLSRYPEGWFEEKERSYSRRAESRKIRGDIVTKYGEKWYTLPEATSEYAERLRLLER